MVLANTLVTRIIVACSVAKNGVLLSPYCPLTHQIWTLRHCGLNTHIIFRSTSSMDVCFHYRFSEAFNIEQSFIKTILFPCSSCFHEQNVGVVSWNVKNVRKENNGLSSVLSFLAGGYIFIYCVETTGNISVLLLSFLSRGYNFM